MNYPAYTTNNQYYMQNLQDMRDRIDKQMHQLQMQNQNQVQAQQPQAITQNFQLAPTQNTNSNELESRYAENVDQVKNTFVIKIGVFVNKDFSTLWVKDVNGNIRTFNTQEIIEIDEKDKEILELKKQIEEMKGMILNANESVDANVDDEVTKTKSTRVSNAKRSNAK